MLGVLLLVIAGITAQLRSLPGPTAKRESTTIADSAQTGGAGDRSSDSAHGTEEGSRSAGTVDSNDLSELDIRFRRRVEKLAEEIQSRLVDLGPSEGIAYLQQLLSRHADWSENDMSDDRIRRVLAASFLPWVVDRDRTLGATVLHLTMSLAQGEQDPEVRWQLLGSLVGAGVKPTVVRISGRGETESRPVEGFAAEFGHHSLSRWKKALLEVIERDPKAMDFLEAVAMRVHQEPARQIVLDGLALMENERAKAFVVGLFRDDPTSRPRLVAALARRDDLEVLEAFVSALERERDQYLISIILKRIATSSHARDGWGRVLKDQYTRLGGDKSSLVGQPNVVSASARVFATVRDKDAFSVVVGALGSEDSRVFRSAVAAIQKNPDNEYVPELTTQLGRATHPYVKEEISYALKKIDPNAPYDSLMWDIDLLISRAKEKLTPEEKNRVEEQLSEKRARLEAVRKRP